MYLAFYYVGVLDEAAPVRDPEYGSSFVGKHEQGYDGVLVPIKEAVELLSGGILRVDDGGAIRTRRGNALTLEDISGIDEGAVEAICVAEAWWQIQVELREAEKEKERIEKELVREVDEAMEKVEKL